MSHVTDPDWLKHFGTTDSQLEPVPVLKPKRLKRHQQQAKFIKANPELFGGKPKQPTLFPETGDHDHVDHDQE